MQVLPFHAAMTQESRLASMAEFTRSPSQGVSQFMVCTDRYLSVLTHFFFAFLTFCYVNFHW